MYYTVHSRTSMAWIRKIVGLSLLVLLAAILMRKVPFDPDTLKNERVVVCGASSGIGEGIAYYYSKFGAKVFLAARRWKELERVKRKCKKLGAGDAQYVAVDLGLDAGILTLVKESLAAFGGIDVLVLNHFKAFMDEWNPANWTLPQTPDEILTEQFRINALSYMKLATKFLPELQKSSGRIGVVSSVAGVISVAHAAPYGACKAALHAFFNSLRMELIARKMNTSITISVLGAIATDTMIAGMNKYPGLRRQDLYPVDECALNIVQAITRRERLIFYPNFFKFIQFLNFLFPEFMETQMLKNEFPSRN